MPKIIENIREKLLSEAREQLFSKGYSAVTVRSVAKACGVGVGTLYNYFPSKEILVASFMLEDWKVFMGKAGEEVKALTSASDVFRCVYLGLRAFTEKYERLFSDTAANRDRGTVGDNHRLLRSQISALILPVCEKSGAENVPFLTDFVSEALITWTVEGRSFEEIDSMLCKLFN